MNKLIKGLLVLALLLAVFPIAAVFGMVTALGVQNFRPEMIFGISSFSSMLPSVCNTFLLIVATLLLSVPPALFAAIFLWFYGHKRRFWVSILQALIDALGAIPSIIYALFGLIVFVNTAGLGFSFLSGVLTMTIVVLPILVRAVEQTFWSVPKEVYYSGVALGISKMQVILSVMIPETLRGIASGVMLSMGRIIGESAALIFTLGTASGFIKSFSSSGKTMAVHLYSLTTEGLYLQDAYGAALILLVFVIIFNIISYFLLRKRDDYE